MTPAERLARLPRNRYGVILADPPWLFETYSDKGKSKSPERHYDTMTYDDLCAMPVGDLAAPDCALFLWLTWPIILHKDDSGRNVINRLLDAWGFTYSGLAWEWFKYNEGTEKFAFGTGRVTRKNLEPLIVARRGSPKLLNRSVRDFIFAKRREHSRKPDETHDQIVSMYPGPYLELFGRWQRPGWTVWGNETDKFIAPELEGLI